MKTVDVGVWGSTGYAGQELVGILQGHPNVGHIETIGREMADSIDIEVAFLALPPGVSGDVARQLRKAGSTVVDLSGDFRFQTAEEYETWYPQQAPHPAPELLPAPYGIPELNREAMIGSKLISNPGCYPTATLLGITPIIKEQLTVSGKPIVIDALSGVSGMGKDKREEADRIIAGGESYAYKVGRVHQHVGEMEQFLAGNEVFFSPSVGPYFRGMLVKTTAELRDGVGCEAIQETLNQAYEEEPFVQVLPEGEVPSVETTVNTDVCSIGFVVVGKTLQIISSIDNLRKGAASQAVQGFNLTQGFPETSGLRPAV